MSAAQRTLTDLISRVLHLQVLDVTESNESQHDGPPATINIATAAKPSHAPNFETVSWKGRMYKLTQQQRIIIAILWRAWEDGHPFISGAYLLERADTAANKLSVVFRKSEAWGNLIVQGEVQGGPIDTYCLAE
jgi:hypothetical protein